MAATFVVENSTTKVVHEMRGPSSKVVKGYRSAAHWLWHKDTSEDRPAWSTLTDQDKLDIVQAALIKHIRAWSRNWLVEDGKATGAATGDQDYQDNVQVDDV